MDLPASVEIKSGDPMPVCRHLTAKHRHHNGADMLCGDWRICRNVLSEVKVNTGRSDSIVPALMIHSAVSGRLNPALQL
ncbi:hypothetical protein CHU98_g9634 [Xylaria longipes]|nr:hypothetical protein CHU98_g9634 [Xylaria longipes]